MRAPIACLILASGHSTRFGSNKLLANFCGQPLIYHILTKLQALALPCLVVTRFPEIAALCQKLHLPVLQHNEPYQNDTIHLGLTALSQQAAYAGYMFCTADQPLLQLSTLQKLLTAFQQQPEYIYRLSYQNIPGNPVIFPARYLEQLLALPQDCGGSYILKQHLEQIRYVETISLEELCDIDTPKELIKLEQRHIICQTKH